MAQPAVQADRYTYADYLKWPDDIRCELIDGVIYDMSPAPSIEHQRSSRSLTTQIDTYLEGKPCELFVAPFDVRLPERDEADQDVETVVQPDLCVVCDNSKLDRRGCRGAPDWIIEILSPSTAAKDQTIKLDLFERHGVREYWLLHPVDKVLTRYLLEDRRFGRPVITALEGHTPVNVLPELLIDWARALRSGLPESDVDG